MDIKRLNNGAGALPASADVERAKTSAQPGPGTDMDAVPAGALDGVRAGYKRADLNSPKFDAILRKSIDALLDSEAASGSAIPSSVRQKAADFLAGDPLFASRVRLFWDKNLN
jgi:hypothetical protein